MSESDVDLPAQAVFRLEVQEPSTASRVGRFVGAVTAGLLTFGAGPTNAGGRRMVIRELDTEDVMATWPETAFDEHHDLFGRIESDLSSMTADEFARQWIEGQTD